MKRLLFAGLLGLMGMLPVAEAQQRVVRQGVQAAEPSADVAENSDLGANYAVKLAGSLGAGTKVDVTVSGLGKRFVASSPLEGGNMVGIEYVVEKEGDRFKVNYSITFQIALPNGNNGLEYKTYAMTGGVFCVPGKPAEIYKSGEQSLSLAISASEPK